MRLNNVLTGFVLNFFLGVAWAIVFIGIIISFFSYYDKSIAFAILACVFGALPGLLLVLILEHVMTTKEKLQELQKQTEILQKLVTNKEQQY